MGDFCEKNIYCLSCCCREVAASAFGAVTIKKYFEKSNLKINEKSSLSEIIEFYNRSVVKNSKDYKDFNLDVNTSVQLDEISSSSTF